MFDTAAIQTHAKPLLQSEAFFRALIAAGQNPSRLADGTLVTTRQFAGGLRLCQIPRADMDTPDLPKLIADAGLGRHPFLLTPDRPCTHLKRIGAVRLSRSPQVMEMPLDHGREARLDTIWRRRLAHARSQDLQIATTNLPMDPGHWIFGDPRGTSRRHLPASVLTLAYAAANPGDAKLFTAYLGQTRIAAVLLLLHEDAATWHLTRTTPHGRVRGAEHLLMWTALGWLSDHGTKRLDLGALTGPAPETTGFRLGMGAQIRPLGDIWGWWPPLARLRWGRRSRPTTLGVTGAS
ncbi:MAG: GNAT family N-acetyltransferase [Pseudomonadota bacterium]